MKKKMLALLLAAAMVMGLAAPAMAAEESESGKIVILHTNDVHCGIDPVADEETGQTTDPRIWAGGDIVTGAATVILAMGAGKKAAASITKSLLGE